MKKIILVSIIICQLIISCSSDSDGSNATEDEVASLLQKPYSSLTPSQQKVKLENEANSMLLQMENSKSSTALDAFDNFGNLQNISQSEFQIANSGNGIGDLLNISGVYGIYTWNAIQQIWVKTASSTVLKFIFPSNKNSTTNNAILSVTSVASNVKVDIEDTEEIGYWKYNPVTDEYDYIITDPAIYDQIYLPSSVNASLTIDGVKVGEYEASSLYSGGNPEPTQASYKLTFNGYVWENSAKRTSPISIKSSFSYNGNNLIDFNVGSTADIDELIEGSALTPYLGKANCLISLMDNFVMVADMNIEGFVNDQNSLYDNTPEPIYNNPTAVSAYNKTISEGEANTFNKNVKMALVSKKDGTKLADVIQKSEKGEIYYGYQEYDTVLYLRFSDNTEVAMDVYFSSGFDNLTTKFQDFINSF